MKTSDYELIVCGNHEIVVSMEDGKIFAESINADSFETSVKESSSIRNMIKHIIKRSAKSFIDCEQTCCRVKI